MAESFDVPIGPLEWDIACKFGGGKVKAHLRQLTSEEEDSCFEYSTAKTIRLNKSRYVRLGCMSVAGLTVNGKPITSGEEVSDSPGLFVLLAELFVAIQKGSDLSEAETKNS